MSAQRHLGWSACFLALAAVCAVLAVQVLVWLFVAVPFLLGGAYAAWLGMGPGRFFNALDDGTGSTPPF